MAIPRGLCEAPEVACNPLVVGRLRLLDVTILGRPINSLPAELLSGEAPVPIVTVQHPLVFNSARNSRFTRISVVRQRSTDNPVHCNVQSEAGAFTDPALHQPWINEMCRLTHACLSLFCFEILGR
jgi:hypothetical protein